MSDTKTYQGSCHCGQVAYEADTDLRLVVSCNCSICRKRGTLLTFVPEDKFSLKSGGEALTDYLFNKKVIHHVFCPTCGVGSFARGIRPDGAKMVAVNVRCLDGVDLDTLNIKKIDGASF
ncbi:MAG: GFA family protein [Hyphomicrobium sp.]|nr:GFA family protein [Hyphomicrobium sp.]